MTWRWENNNNISNILHNTVTWIRLCLLWMLNCVSSHIHVFTRVGLCRLSLCVCDCIWCMWCSLPGRANEMQTTQAESSSDVIYALLLREEEGRDVARCLSICVFVYVRPLGTACCRVCVRLGAVQTEAGWWINHGTIARVCRSRGA